MEGTTNFTRLWFSLPWWGRYSNWNTETQTCKYMTIVAIEDKRAHYTQTLLSVLLVAYSIDKLKCHLRIIKTELTCNLANTKT